MIVTKGITRTGIWINGVLLFVINTKMMLILKHLGVPDYPKVKYNSC